MLDSDFSDLTDIDDEEDVPLSQAHPGRKKGDADSYRIRGALTAPRATSYTTQALHEMLAQGDINLEADYQRDIVWHSTKQTVLIDSIFKNFYVPPVIFAVTYTDGFEKRVCIDGKQRLTSIWNFMQGTIPFKDSLSGEKFYYTENAPGVDKGKYKLLPERYRRMFKTKQIVCVEYSDLNPDSEREIFQRVQLGVALNAAEKLQAVHGPTSIFIRDIMATFVHEGLENSLEWDTSRANDFRCIATALNLIEKWPCKVATMPALTKWLQRDDELDPAFMENVRLTFKIFSVMGKLPEYQSGFRIEDKRAKKDEKLFKVAPAEFICAALLIAQHKSKLTLLQLSEAIRKMRLDVRRQEQDIRTNSRVFGHMLKYIKELKPSMLTNDDAKPASVVGPILYKRKVEAKDVKVAKEATPPSPSGKKRKAQDSDDDEYTETRKTPSSSKKPATKVAKPSPPAPVAAAPPVTAPPPTPVTAPPPPRAPAAGPSQYPVSKPSSSFHTAPPAAAGPSSYPSQPSGPQMHSMGQMNPDRLAAIRSVRATANTPRQHEPSAAGPSGNAWNTRLTSDTHTQMPPSSLPPAPARGQNPNSLSQTLMSRMQMSFSVPPAQSGSESYDPRRPAEPMQHNAGRGGVNQWGQRPY